MNRLYFRLLVSFLLLLLITLCVIGAALMVFLSSRPVPTESIINDLALELVEIDLREEIETWRDQNPRDRDAELNYVGGLMDENAISSGYRFILMSEDGLILHDTAGLYEREDRLPPPPTEPLLPSRPLGLFQEGSFQQNGQDWLFVTRRLGLGNLRPNNNNGNNPPQGRDFALLAATPRPEQTPRRVIRDFGENFLRPLCQAGIIGLLIAFFLSLLLARSVARPLQSIAKATEQVAAGNYDQHVPVAGFTEAKLVAQSFNEMTHQVKLNEQAQRDFLANVSHELRTPLTSIQGFSQAIIDGVAAAPDAAERAAEIIYEEAGRLNRLVNDLLDLARIQGGKMQMLRQTVELDLLLKKIGESLSIKARDKNITLQMELVPFMRIAGDGDRLAQVFTNLLDNAVKHTDSGGRVWLKSEPSGLGVMIRVQDTGEGIPPEDLARIFERFYQVDKSRNRDSKSNSAGLGLAITHEIILAHGGEITVESQVGVGTRFNVWLPTLPADQSTLVRRRV